MKLKVSNYIMTHISVNCDILYYLRASVKYNFIGSILISTEEHFIYSTIKNFFKKLAA